MGTPETYRGLIIEDDDDIVGLFIYCFKDAGWTWDVATTSKAGIARIHAVNNGYDIIVLDLGLPDCEGIETLRRIRKGSNAPIVVQTGGDLHEIELVRDELCVYGILGKGSMHCSRVKDAVLGAIGQWRAERYKSAAQIIQDTKREFRREFLGLES